MKSLLTIILFGVLSTSAFANWEELSSKKFSASNRKDVYRLFNHHETADSLLWILKDESARSVAGFYKRRVVVIKIHITKYKWIGPNSCAPEDPRQYSTSDGGSILYSDRIRTEWVTTAGHPGDDWDPCAEESLKIPAKNLYRKNHKIGGD